jgi:hypothetical protein
MRCWFQVALLFLAGLIFVGGAHAADQATQLCNTLSRTQPSQLPRQFVSASTGAVAPNANDQQSGITCVASLKLAGDSFSGEIRYAVFPSAQQAKAYSSVFDGAIGASINPRFFLPYMPSADCVRNGAGDTQACGISSGNVFVIGVSRGIVTANTREGQVIRGIGAGNLVQYGIRHLNAVRGSLGLATAEAYSDVPQPFAAPSAPAGQPSTSNPCTILTKSEAAAAMRSPVMDARFDSMSTCYYGSQMMPGNGVALQLNDGGRSKFDFDHGRMSGTRTVPNTGDAAFEFASAAGFVQLYVVKGNTYFTITLTNQRDPHLSRTAIQLARQIASQVPE